ncbi:hypothetical protein JW960_28660 [candidate division KSB1 bacterium]|nr:hypothetical protein [candidate division KSB1 bacterium]
MQSIIYLLIISLAYIPAPMLAQEPLKGSVFESLSDTHDLISLPAWGPYTKKYIGISHIPDVQQGIRFDLSVFPGFYRRKIDVPNVFFENEYHPWEASPQYEYFSFRHEIEWKDRVYADISYSYIDENSRLVRIECVNNTEINQSIALHFIASIHFPPIKEYSPYTPIYPGIIELPASYHWIDALDYKDMRFAKVRPSDNLVYDGKFRGEIRQSGFINGAGLGQNFGKDKGDFVVYNVSNDEDISDAILYFRYKMEKNAEIKFELTGLVGTGVTFTGTGELSVKQIKVGKIAAGSHQIKFVSNGGAPIEFDGFTFINSKDVSKIKIINTEWHPVPEILDGPDDKSIILKYEDIDTYYGIRWDYDHFIVRQWFCRDLDGFFRRMTNNHTRTILRGEGEGHFTNVFLRPINLAPKSMQIFYGIVCSGGKEEVESKLANLKQTPETYENINNEAKTHLVDFDLRGAGERYAFSQKRMAATTLCDVVYPVYTQRSYIRHGTPGRYWDCLYTWDSGFIGLGLLELNTQRAIESLNTYTMKPGAQSAFLHHGTPLPVQQYLFLSLWNRTQSKALLDYFYPRMKQYHEFLAGRLGSSTTRNLKSNIIRTWDYFYNSGGWDDYPPQKYVDENKLTATVAPVINSAHCIRMAKILKMAAANSGKEEDIPAYDQDIKILTEALQKYSWDEESQYFGYVVHDDNGNPLHILKYNDSVNFNMGLDGCYPLFAGICSQEQKSIILKRLKSDKHIWSHIGLTAVDQSAPYYSIEGYWNGTVWMPHQWFFWKTMLDLGESDFAYKIASTALELWEKEVATTYNCMEHFEIESGRGAGWHEFSGLSAPVLSWYAAYFRPGNLTTGYNIWIQNQESNSEHSSMTAELSIFDENNNPFCSVVACMNPDYKYNVFWNNKKLEAKYFAEGTLSIDLRIEGDITGGILKIEKE